MNNISQSIDEKRCRKLHNRKGHPISMLKELVQQYFHDFKTFDHLSETVTVKDNFDELLIPENHPSRGLTDTYYFDKDHVLRTHTSAHQTELLKNGHRKFLVTGDVYRKDTIDRRHYPVFHQMEGVKIMESGYPMEDLLKNTLGLVNFLFPGCEYRVLEDHFPFTDPSIQVEIKINNNWVEILGAGCIHKKILQNCGIKSPGWAFGLGLDRLAMKKCAIPDIRFFWTEDPRFHEQFQNGLVMFQEYSKYPPLYRDISFWVNGYSENDENQWERHNDFCEMVRESCDDWIEDVEIIDKYENGSTTSLAYRIGYRSYTRTLTNEEVNQVQEYIRSKTEEIFDVILR